jgi:hypothetical protein
MQERVTDLGQSTCLIRKDILDLTKIVRQIPASGNGGLVCLLVPYVLVEIDERRLNSPDSFNGDV